MRPSASQAFLAISTCCRDGYSQFNIILNYAWYLAALSMRPAIVAAGIFQHIFLKSFKIFASISLVVIKTLSVYKCMQ